MEAKYQIQNVTYSGSWVGTEGLEFYLQGNVMPVGLQIWLILVDSQGRSAAIAFETNVPFNSLPQVQILSLSHVLANGGYSLEKTIGNALIPKIVENASLEVGLTQVVAPQVFFRLVSPYFSTGVEVPPSAVQRYAGNTQKTAA